MRAQNGGGMSEHAQAQLDDLNTQVRKIYSYCERKPVIGEVAS